MSSDIMRSLENYGIIPVLKFDQLDDAVPTAKALIAGGVDVAEVTFRTDCAAPAIQAMRKEFPAMLVGAGTVLTTDQAEQALKAGAQFIVSPCLDENVAAVCRKAGVPYIPGCSTPGDVGRAVALGLNVVKFFPAEIAGGMPAIRALRAVYGDVRFIPTGGITAENIGSYANDPAVVACGGSWMAPANLIAAGNFAEITRLTRDAVFALLRFDFAHFGINCETADEGYKNIFRLADTFDLILGDTPSSTYVGRNVEITKQPFKVRGPHGHLGYFTDNLARAKFYLEKKGLAFNEASVKNYQDKMYVIYLKDELAGFAIHIEERNDHNPPRWEHRDIVKERIGWQSAT